MHTSMRGQTFADIHLPIAGELAIGAAASTWIAKGFRVMRSSTIDGACASFSHNTCPHTGKSPCDCLLVVLFVSRNDESPVAVVAHGHEDDTTFTLQQDGPAVDEASAQRVWQALGSLIRLG